jgi:hypothetical protein
LVLSNWAAQVVNRPVERAILTRSAHKFSRFKLVAQISWHAAPKSRQWVDRRWCLSHSHARLGAAALNGRHEITFLHMIPVRGTIWKFWFARRFRIDVENSRMVAGRSRLSPRPVRFLCTRISAEILSTAQNISEMALWSFSVAPRQLSCRLSILEIQRSRSQKIPNKILRFISSFYSIRS